MKKLILVFLVSLVVFTSCKENTEKKDEISTYYLIRHAEKDRSDSTNKNPKLTEEGLKRAQNWAEYFKDLKFDAVYTTDYIRTKQTALPTAKANNIELSFYDPRNLKTEEFMKTNKGKTVLIVGHSNTTPMFANGLLGQKKYKDIDDNNNSNLYIVTVKNDSISSSILVVD